MRDNCCTQFLKFLVSYVLGPLIILPLGLLVVPFFRLHDGFKFLWFQGRRLSTPEEHKRKVTRVQEQVRAWNAGGRKARMCTARPAWSSISVHTMDKRNLSKIDLGPLNSIVEVDEVNRVITVEPGIMMGQLTSILIPRGWTIPVIPEFEILSVGGVICGAGLETSSTQYGIVADTPIEYEVVLSSGDVVTCSKDNNSDIFYSIPMSHGTIGFLTAVKFPLLPAKKYVKLEYHAVESISEAQALLETQDHEFVEGFVFSRHKFVIMHGDMTDHADPKIGSVNCINRWYKPFFYKHTESFLGRKGLKTEYIPLRDYYHRHSRPYFWVGPIVLPFLNNCLFLALFGWFVPILDVQLVKRVANLFVSPRSYNSLVIFFNTLQDFVLPMKHFRATLDFFHDLVGVYPLWLCPCKEFKKPGMIHCSEDVEGESELSFDIGIYGNVAKEARAAFHPVNTTRQMEEFVIERKGFQGTYADMFLTREQFRTMFDMRLYDKVRTKYDCLDAFPDVYDKVGKAARGIDVMFDDV